MQTHLIRCSALAWCAMLLPQAASAQNDTTLAPATKQPCVELLSSEEAWSRLPPLAKPLQEPLPNWARCLAHTLPATTAAMLELDYKLRATGDEATQQCYAVARLAVARELQCDYLIQYAVADLARCHAPTTWSSDAQVKNALPAQMQSIYRFAQQMTRAARDVSDEELEKLRVELGEPKLVGLVLAIGYANFTGRLALALNLPNDTSASMDPIQVDFEGSTPTGADAQAAARPEIPVEPIVSNATPAGRALLSNDWRELNIQHLRQKLEQQRERDSRIRVPDWEEIREQLPAGLYPQPLRIRWSRVVVGYQPEIGPAWIKCLRVFEREAHQDRVFEESVFWVVTRGLKCFYCMGHCEMLMEVGGLSEAQIQERTERLASGNWSSFTAAEQSALQYAHQLTGEPQSITCADFERLVKALGSERALDCVWWICRCQFMTKVSDAFQLTLERENVFAR